MIEHYEHHGTLVSVDSALKGQHRAHCLCFKCAHFKPEDREQNCPIANQVFNICVEHHLVTPVYECPAFEEKVVEGA